METFTKEQLDEILKKETTKTRIATEERLKKHYVQKETYESILKEKEALASQIQEFEQAQADNKFNSDLYNAYKAKGGNDKLFKAFAAVNRDTLREQENIEKGIAQLKDQEDNKIYFEEFNVANDLNDSKNVVVKKESPFVPGSTVRKYRNI